MTDQDHIDHEYLKHRTEYLTVVGGFAVLVTIWCAFWMSVASDDKHGDNAIEMRINDISHDHDGHDHHDHKH